MSVAEDFKQSSAPRRVDARNKLNDLTAAEWITRTVSVFVQKGMGKDSREAKIEKQHPAPFSFRDVSRFVEFFTKEGGVVLDPFCGVGSALKAAALLGRSSIGIELNPHFAQLTRERMLSEVTPNLLGHTAQFDLLEGDARTQIDLVKDDSVDLLLTSPPYWGILEKIDHKARQERLDRGLAHNYGESHADFAAIPDYETFVDELAALFSRFATKLKSKKYAVIIVSDFRHKDSYYLFHSDLAKALESRGAYKLRGVIIIHQKFKRVFPYGYPYAFVPNVHHQYALVLQKVA